MFDWLRNIVGRPSVNITITPLVGFSPEMERANELSRQATARKQAGDFDGAIGLLRNAERLVGTDEKARVRIALYYAASGDIASAYHELLVGVDETRRRVDDSFSQHTPDVRMGARAMAYQHFADKARLIAKRAKLTEVLALHDALFEEACGFSRMQQTLDAEGQVVPPSLPYADRAVTEAALIDAMRARFSVDATAPPSPAAPL